jgi:hypothetical protein
MNSCTFIEQLGLFNRKKNFRRRLKTAGKELGGDFA